jgi:hypothetical protein
VAATYPPRSSVTLWIAAAPPTHASRSRARRIISHPLELGLSLAGECLPVFDELEWPFAGVGVRVALPAHKGSSWRRPPPPAAPRASQLVESEMACAVGGWMLLAGGREVHAVRGGGRVGRVAMPS